jgi:predicted metal-binding membrane protein
VSGAASSALERLLRRERRIVVAGLLLVVTAAWGYTLAGAGMGLAEWSPRYAALMLAMWWVMMVAMMLPSAAPTILLATAINRRSAQPPYGSAGFFAAGYLLAWFGFSVFATAAQWALETTGQLSAALRLTSPYLAGALLLAAGVWQLTPLKQACLRHCQSPVDYLTRHRRPGSGGALVMGAGHGSYCLGCCVFLMALLFVGGVMNLAWIGGLALFVLSEKLLARGAAFSRVAGAALIIAGGVVLAG